MGLIIRLKLVTNLEISYHSRNFRIGKCLAKIFVMKGMSIRFEVL